MKKIQTNLLDYLENDSSDELNQEIKNISKIITNKYDFKSFLNIIMRIAENHNRSHNFFTRIFNILTYFKEDIKKYFTNPEIYELFKNCKRIILFLVEEKMMIIDEAIIKKMIYHPREYTTKFLLQYFQPEIMPFMYEEWFPESTRGYAKLENEIPENFYEKRRIGENDSIICELIRNDSIDEFSTYVAKNQIALESQIVPTIYETNDYLLTGPNPTLIEYSAFYGSIQIFNYLRFSKAHMPPSIWNYAIHGDNPEIIHILEGNFIEIPNDSFKLLIDESIKCHNNKFANYFIEKVDEMNLNFK